MPEILVRQAQHQEHHCFLVRGLCRLFIAEGNGGNHCGNGYYSSLATRHNPENIQKIETAKKKSLFTADDIFDFYLLFPGDGPGGDNGGSDRIRVL